MRLANFFPIWDQLTDSEKNRLEDAAIFRAADRGTQLHGGDADCIGLLVVCSGQLRAYILNDEGREITLYRLFDHDICLFSASCMLRDIQFDIFIEAETDCELWIIPTPVYKEIMDGSAVVANYTNCIISSRFSEVMARTSLPRSLPGPVCCFLSLHSESYLLLSLLLTYLLPPCSLSA